MELLIAKGADIDPAVSHAAGSSNPAAAKLLVEKGARIDSLDNLGFSPMWWAVELQLVETIKLLLEHGSDVNLCDRYGDTPCLRAAQSGELAIVQLLLNKDADINICNNAGETPLILAAQKGELAIVQLLLDNGADVTAGRRSDGGSALECAILKGSEEIAELLIKHDNRQEFREAKGNIVLVTRLFYHLKFLNFDDDEEKRRANEEALGELLSKIEKSWFEHIPNLLSLHVDNVIKEPRLVTRFLEFGVQVNKTDSYGRTALHMAAANGSTEVVELLLQAGADVNAKNKGDSTPLVCLARAARNAAETIQLLLDYGADIEASDCIGTALCHAVGYGNLSVVQLLLQRGANVEGSFSAQEKKKQKEGEEEEDEEGEENNGNDMVKVKGHDANDDGEGHDHPIHLVIDAWRNPAAAGEILNLLLDHGANIEARDFKGNTALTRAVQDGKFHLVKILLERGADAMTVEPTVKPSDRWIFEGDFESAKELVMEARCKAIVEKGKEKEE